MLKTAYFGNEHGTILEHVCQIVHVHANNVVVLTKISAADTEVHKLSMQMQTRLEYSVQILSFQFEILAQQSHFFPRGINYLDHVLYFLFTFHYFISLVGFAASAIISFFAFSPRQPAL